MELGKISAGKVTEIVVVTDQERKSGRKTEKGERTTTMKTQYNKKKTEDNASMNVISCIMNECGHHKRLTSHDELNK